MATSAQIDTDFEVRLVNSSEGVISLLSTPDNVNAEAFSSDAEVPTVATAVFGINQASATIDDLTGTSRVFSMSVALRDHFGYAGTAVTLTNVDPISLKVLGFGKTGLANLELSVQLTVNEGFASAYYELNDMSEVFTASVSQATQLALNIDQQYGLRAFLFGNSALEGPVDATFKITLTVIGHSPANCKQDVTNAVDLSATAIHFDKHSQTHEQTVKVKNKNQTTLVGPVLLVLDGLTADVTLLNAAGVTTCGTPFGSPYVQFLGDIAPHANISVSLRFSGASKKEVAYRPRVLAGSGLA